MVDFDIVHLSLEGCGPVRSVRPTSFYLMTFDILKYPGHAMLCSAILPDDGVGITQRCGRS